MRGPETFSLVLNSAATEDDLQRWIRAARPGDRAIYASGLALLRDAPGVQLVDRWEREGLVSKSGMGRDPASPRRWQWFVTRNGAGASGSDAAPLAGHAGSCCTPAGRAPALDPVLEALHHLLDELPVARDGWAACPSNNSLADTLDVPRTTARRWMERLREAGLVEIEQGEHGSTRRVRVVAR